MRKLVDRGDPPERVARGIAAGFFAAAFPLPGLQIFLSLLFAWLVRGNKAVAIFPQFLSNAGTMAPLAYFQFWIGLKFWSSKNADVEAAVLALEKAGGSWNWSDPEHSMRSLGAALAALGADVIGPLTLGVLITATVAAALAYPLSLITITYVNWYAVKRRAERGISLRPPRGQLLLPPPSADEVAASNSDLMARYAIHPETYVRADAVRLLVDGCEAYPEMLSSIASARKSISMETYILRADKTGDRFASALAKAAARGVKVRLLYDGVGGMGVPQAYVDQLLKAGVEVAVYRPFSNLLRIGLGPMNRRDHRKILVVDENRAFAGGLNIGDEYAAKADGGDGWRDTHLRLDGETPAKQLVSLTNQTWRRSDKSQLPEWLEKNAPGSGHNEALDVATECGEDAAAATHAAPTSTNVPVQILSNKEFLQRVRVRRAYLHAIRNARRYILIENAYFIPDRGIRRGLRNAVKRGVVVGVVVAMYSDVKLAALASRSLYGELLSSGVRLFEYPKTMLHAKTAVIDDVWSMISSYNLDHRSLLHNLESGVLLMDRRFGEALRQQVLADISHCREVTLQFHKARPWNEALLESMAYQGRYWL